MLAPERVPNGLAYSYDRAGDVLYLTIGEPRRCYCDDIAEGVLLKLDGQTDAVCGATILDFLRRNPVEVERVLPFQVNLALVRQKIAGSSQLHK
jgi:uncharacterized protein YuzE